MKIYRSQFIVFAFAVLFAASFGVRAQITKAHRHFGKMPSMLAEIAPDFSFAETALAKGLRTKNAVRNKNRTFEAFTLSGTRIFVKDLRSGKIFELQGLPFEWRDFSDLVWADNQTLMFDRWTQPRYGNHYAVDVVKRKLIDVVPFPDELTFKQK